MTSTTPAPRRGADLIRLPRPATDESRSQVLNIGLMAVAAHAAHHKLPAPHAITLEVDPREEVGIEICIAGVGNQQRWLNTVVVDDQEEHHRGHASRITWHVRLPETGTRIRLSGLRTSTEPVR